MTKGKEHYKQNIYDNAFVRPFVATNTAMMEYPFMVGRYDESSPTNVENAEEYILDSAIGDPSVGNADVLNRAEQIGAEIVVAADVMGEPVTTTEAIVDMVEREREHEQDFEVLVPLQFDDEMTHGDHYDMVADALADIGVDITNYRLYVGGINQTSNFEQIRRCMKLREHVGTDAYLHGLGIGATREWIATIRQCPWLLDSFDNSTVVKNFVYSGLLLKPDGTWADFDRPRGANSTALSVQYREASLDMLNYMLGSDIREADAITETDDDDIDVLIEQHQSWHERQ